jgi:hypothetical protein
MAVSLPGTRLAHGAPLFAIEHGAVRTLPIISTASTMPAVHARA